VKSLVARIGAALLGQKAKPPRTRLSEAQAVEIASAYARAGKLEGSDVKLVVHEVRDTGGRVLWTLRTPTVGRWLTVEIDDTTGEVLNHQVHGVR
jgi:hypothetical protein